MKCLIVDDDAMSRQLLASILKQDPDNQTTLATGGREGWHILDDPGRSFDVVFLDVHMPDPDGFEVLRRIRESPFLKSLEVILCTASNNRETVIKAAKLGARHFIAKPCKEDVVRRKLAQIQAASNAPAPRLKSAVIKETTTMSPFQ